MIRIVLIALALGIAVNYFRRFRTRATDRLVAVVFSILTVTAIIFPDSTTTIAHSLGVGRGADLVFYLFIMASSFAIVLLYSRNLSLEAKMTQLVREIAVRDAQ